MPWGTRPPTGSFSGRDSGLPGARAGSSRWGSVPCIPRPDTGTSGGGGAPAGGKRALGGRRRRAYDRMPSVSVDYGILEKEDGILVIPTEFGWNDIGTWRSLHEFLGAGENVTARNVIPSGQPRGPRPGGPG